MDTSILTSLGVNLEEIDLTTMPQKLKMLKDFLILAQAKTPLLNELLNQKFQINKANLIRFELIAKNNKIFVWVREIGQKEGKDVVIKTHWKGELFELIFSLEKHIPFEIK